MLSFSNSFIKNQKKKENILFHTFKTLDNTNKCTVAENRSMVSGDRGGQEGKCGIKNGHRKLLG